MEKTLNRYYIFGQRILLLNENDYKEESIKSAISTVKESVKEKLETNQEIVDDLSDFCIVALQLAEELEKDNFNESVMIRVMIEDIFDMVDSDEFADDESE